MTDTQAHKTILEEEAKRLETELATIGRRNPSNKADWEAVPPEGGEQADPNDTASQLEAYGDNAAILNDLEPRYNEVLAALERIEDGTYDACVVCGEPIEEDRLRADSAATTCVAHIA